MFALFNHSIRNPRFKLKPSLNFLAKKIAKVECERHSLVKLLAKTKCQPKAVRADEKR
jgi:hypothetical protein